MEDITKIRIVVNGVNQNKIYKILQKNNINATNINRLNYKQMELDLNKSDFKILNKLLINTNFKIEVQQNYGNNKTKNFFRKRFGILIGLLIAVVVLIVYNMFIWNIEIVGLDKISYQELIAKLNENGVKVGGLKNKLNTELLEKSLYNDFENISLVSVINKGTTLIINIKESLYVDEIESKGEKSNIVSKFDCVITEINVLQGTTYFKKGDSVKKGDVIVYGYEQDSFSNRIDCFANAEIKAQVICQETIEYDTKGYSFVKTGKKECKTIINIFNLFKNNSQKTNFEFYEQEIQESLVFKNLFFPFKKTTYTFFELKKQENNPNFEEIKEELEAKALKLAEKKLPNSLQKEKSFCIINNIDTVYYITAYAVANIEI